jgi:acetylornithine/succinyldiaminopimelate/putrescine aminotransferase
MKRFLRKLSTSGPLLPLYARPNQLFTHGEGCYLIDSTGRKYIDFTSGIAVNALGHNHPEVVKIIRDQAGKLIHLSNLYHNEYAQGLAQMIVNSLDGDPKLDKGQVFFSNSGTEANEGCSVGFFNISRSI